MPLTAAIKQFLRDEPEIIAYLEESLQKPEFEADYAPRRIEILHDDILFISHQAGEQPYIRAMPENYEIPFTEIRFDGEVALFLVRNKAVVNRIQKMVALDEILNEFVPVPLNVE